MPRSAAFPALAFALALSACRDWRAGVEPERARAEPVQEALAAPPVEYELEGYAIRLLPRASYRITGYAVDTSRELLDQWDFVVPMDLALVWGPLADPAVLRHLRFHLSRRYVSWFADGPIPGVPQPVIESHVSNNHLLPADEEVARALSRIRRGDLVTLAGKLVDVEIRDGRGAEVARMRTSLTRTDVGSGACENVYVEAVDVER